VKYIVFGLSRCPSISVHHFLGLSDNGYSRALLRSNEEKTFNAAIEKHLAKIAESSFADVTYPLLRAHCFGILRMAVIGFAIAANDDLPEDQASLLLYAWDALCKLEFTDEALLLGYYLLKLNEEVADIGILSDSVPGIRDFSVRCNYNKIAQNVEATEDDVLEMANTELDEVLAGMSEYSPDEVLKAMREMQAELTRLELRQASQAPSPVEIRDVDLDDLVEVASERYDLTQFLAARTLTAVLGNASTLQRTVQTLVKENVVVLKTLAFLCTSEHVEVCKAAVGALKVVCESTGDKALLEQSGLLEAAVYLLSHSSLGIVSLAVKALASLSTNKTCAEVLLASLRKQIGAALLDHVFQSDAALVSAVAGFAVKLFGVSDKKGATAFVQEMIPDIAEEDLRDSVAVLAKELKVEVTASPNPSKKTASVAAAAVAAPPPAGKKQDAKLVAAAKKEVYSDEEDEAQSNSNATTIENSEIFLDPEAQEELERELAGMDDFDDSVLSEVSQIEAEDLMAQGEDERTIALLKMGAKLEEEANEKLEQDLVDEAEHLLDQALTK
jgi:hypothetical protein